MKIKNPLKGACSMYINREEEPNPEDEKGEETVDASDERAVADVLNAIGIIELPDGSVANISANGINVVLANKRSVHVCLCIEND
jgi:hypothetical protein